MAELPNFSIHFDYIIGDYDLINLVDEISQADEQNKQREETGNERFMNLTTKELDSLVEKSQALSTKTNTKWP